jgi:tRNA dimethylallyltransferase
MSSSDGSADADAGSVPVICGPTGAGKSAIAVWLAERHDVVIISADSRQVYRGLNVGTGKPDAAERARIPHRGLDVADPVERYSAAAWSAMAQAAIAEARAVGRVPLVVGGTGFYISALFRPLWEEPRLDPVARAAVQAGLAELSTDELRRWCRTLDPARAELGRTQLLRALEIALLTGSRLSDHHRTGARRARYTGCYLVVDPGMPLASRIATRAAAMIASGWVDEVRSLIQSVPDTAPAWNATGYRVVRQLAVGEIGEAEALERVTIETRQFAKRQRTWFRHQLDDNRAERLTPDAPGWEDTVQQWFKRTVASL